MARKDTKTPAVAPAATPAFAPATIAGAKAPAAGADPGAIDVHGAVPLARVDSTEPEERKAQFQFLLSIPPLLSIRLPVS